MRFGWQTRLSRSREIEGVFQSGRRVNGGFFLMIHTFREDGSGYSGPRLCVIASKRVAHDAVVRNRMRRRMRDLFRREYAQLPDRLDLILIARRAMITVPFEELHRRFQKACTGIQLPQSCPSDFTGNSCADTPVDTNNPDRPPVGAAKTDLL